LTGTKAELESPRAVTAAKGHVSVTIDRLGYDSSGKPQGFGSCIGGQADIAHQIIGDLKSGAYKGSLTPSFKRVGLIGHSAGGQITEVESYSFGDAAAIGILAYADQGDSAFQLALAAGATAVCSAGGEPSNETSGPGGYAKLGQAKQEGREAFFASAPARVQFETLNVLTANPCGDLASYAAAPATDLANIGQIKVPVLAVQGGQDKLFPVPDVKTQSTLFTGSSSVTFATLARSAHALTWRANTVASKRSSPSSYPSTASEPAEKTRRER
jgi:pimeloyl-ACP methyl ester carboxylesterase